MEISYAIGQIIFAIFVVVAIHNLFKILQEGIQFLIISKQKKVVDKLLKVIKIIECDPVYQKVDIEKLNEANMIEDKKKNDEKEKVKANVSRKSILRAGTKIVLSDVDVYHSSNNSIPFTSLSGEYYTWDDNIVNNRIRIVDAIIKTGIKDYIIGWVKYDFDNISLYDDTSESSSVKYDEKIKLINAFVYDNAYSSNYLNIVSGTYYVSSSPPLNGRVLIRKNKKYSNYIGWINIKDIYYKYIY